MRVTPQVALAMLVASTTRGPRALALVAGYLVASTLVSAPYDRWRAGIHARADVPRDSNPTAESSALAKASLRRAP